MNEGLMHHTAVSLWRFCGSVVSGGFTIVEILIVGTVVFVLLGGVTVVLGNVSQQIWTRTEPRLIALTDAQRALDRVSEDLRAASSASVNDTLPNRCRANLLSFRQPVNPPGTNNRVRYYLSGSSGDVLTRDFDALDDGTGILTQTIVTGVTTFTPTCQPGGLVVGLALAAQVTTPQGQATQTFDSNVRVRIP